MLRIPHCLDNRLIDGGKVISLTHPPHFTLQKHYYFNPSGIHFCQRLSKPQGLVRVRLFCNLKKNNSSKIRVYFPQMSAAAFCFACILFLSATKGLRNSTQCNNVCRRESCGVKIPSDCHAGEQYVRNRRWCKCWLANCCAACVTTVGT
jgi:hypothetical protein